MQVLKPVAVIAAGAGLAFLLAAAALWAALASLGSGPTDWSAAEGTRILLSWTAVVLVHLLWIATWWLWRGLGWGRFVAALLLVPVTGLMVWMAAASVWEISTGSGAPEMHAMEPSVTWPGAAVVLVPASIVAIGVLVTVLVPAPGDGDSMFVRPMWEPRTVLRGFAIAAAVLGSAVLAAILVFLLLAMAGLV
ncbi:MAG: hypothetical protein ACTMHL_05670 [Janibacter sp.]